MRVFILCGHGFRVEGVRGAVWYAERGGPAGHQPRRAGCVATRSGDPGRLPTPCSARARIDRSGLRATQAPGELIRLGGGGRRTALQEFVSELENLFEIISPDAFLRPYLDDCDAIM
jgi:hypothetical protein